MSKWPERIAAAGAVAMIALAIALLTYLIVTSAPAKAAKAEAMLAPAATTVTLASERWGDVYKVFDRDAGRVCYVVKSGYGIGINCFNMKVGE